MYKKPSIHPQLRKFPVNFTWGVATAAAQIEGAVDVDGKGDSNWDHFSRQPNRIRHGDTPVVACDHYYRFEEDIALMAKLGLRNYRFSISWPRIIPDGDGTVNQAGIDFYLRLINCLDSHSITPWVTLFHWDLPQSLEERGGWRSRETVDAFAHYADTVVKALGSRVKNWITVNESGCFTLQAYGNNGPKAPGLNEPAQIVNQTCHHALLAHGHGVRAVRKYGGKGARVGITDDVRGYVPFTECPADIEAAKTCFASNNLRFVDPIYREGYSDEYLKECGNDRPQVLPGDFDLISQETDFLGLNVYTAQYVKADPSGKPEVLPWPNDYPRGGTNWQRFVPQALYWSPRYTAELYDVSSIYITENGSGHIEPDSLDKPLADLSRREMMRSYLSELQRVINDGVPVDGYFHWSLLDNFEWMHGYEIRFGLYHVDYKTQTRTPKLSADYYAAVISENAVV